MNGPAPANPAAPPATGQSLAELLSHLTRCLAAAGIEGAALDARRLAAHALGLDGAGIVLAAGQPVDPAGAQAILAMADRRIAGEPVARITGRRGFHTIELEIGPATLDPRPETETVVEIARALVQRAPGTAGALRILDIGTGSGAIALALLAVLPGARAIATDVSPDALETAARNAARLGLSDRIEFRQTRWAQGVLGPFDLVVTNPPYIRTADLDHLDAAVRLFDPRIALDGGADGLDAYRAIIGDLRRLLAPCGHAVIEVGYDQAEAVESIASSAGLAAAPMPPDARRDLGGHMRCVVLTTGEQDAKIALGIDAHSV